MQCKYKSFGCYDESIHSSPPSGSRAIRGGKNVYCEKVDFFSLWGYSLSPVLFSLTYIQWISPNFFSSHLVLLASLTFSSNTHFFMDIPTILSGRAVPSTMWQPRCLLRGPVSVRGGLDWGRMRPESVPPSLWGTRPVPRRDLHLSAWLGGRSLQHWWAASVHVGVFNYSQWCFDISDLQDKKGVWGIISIHNRLLLSNSHFFFLLHSYSRLGCSCER